MQPELYMSTASRYGNRSGMPFLCYNLFVLATQDQGGVVINITATLHYTGSVLQMHAGSAKAAIGR